MINASTVNIYFYIIIEHTTIFWFYFDQCFILFY